VPRRAAPPEYRPRAVDIRFVISALFSRLLRRRPHAPAAPPPPTAPVPVLPPPTQRPQRAPTASEAAIARDVPPTLTEVLESMIADLGGPVLAVHDDAWRGLGDVRL